MAGIIEYTIKIVPGWSDELYRLAGIVANQIEKRKEEDTDKWADRLSNDLSKLTD